MKSIKSVNLSSLRSLEYNQCISNIVAHLNTLGVAELNLKPVTDKLIAAVKLLDDTLVKAQGSLLTSQLRTIDEERDGVVRAFRAAVKSRMNSTVKERSVAAASLFFVFKKFGDIGGMTFEQETSAIRQLLDELGKENYKAEIKLLHLEDWVEELTAANKKYEQLYIDRTLEMGVKQAHDVRIARIATQQAFEDLCVMIEASIISAGYDTYSELVAFINNAISQAKQSAHLRLALTKKKEPGTPEA